MRKTIVLSAAILCLSACGGNKPKSDEMVQACLSGGAAAITSTSSAGESCRCIVKKVRSRFNASKQQNVLDHWRSQSGQRFGTSLFPRSIENDGKFHPAHYSSDCSIRQMRMSNGDIR